jgi:hypothetical protein
MSIIIFISVKRIIVRKGVPTSRISRISNAVKMPFICHSYAIHMPFICHTSALRYIRLEGIVRNGRTAITFLSILDARDRVLLGRTPRHAVLDRHRRRDPLRLGEDPRRGAVDVAALQCGRPDVLHHDRVHVRHVLVDVYPARAATRDGVVTRARHGAARLAVCRSIRQTQTAVALSFVLDTRKG